MHNTFCSIVKIMIRAYTPRPSPMPYIFIGFWNRYTTLHNIVPLNLPHAQTPEDRESKAKEEKWWYEKVGYYCTLHSNSLYKTQGTLHLFTEGWMPKHTHHDGDGG